ncbi:hypothetical protein AgCh_004359 [Apium graveolens]
MYLLLILVACALGIEGATSGYDTTSIKTDSNHTIMNVGDFAKPGCQTQCGNLKVPYPFGIVSKGNEEHNCSLSRGFQITCNNSANPPKALMNEYLYEIFDISDTELRIGNDVAKSCYNQSGAYSEYIVSNEVDGTTFSYSSANVLSVVGCDDSADSYRDGSLLPKGCTTTCINREEFDEDGCFGTGCCQVPFSARNFYRISLRSFTNHNNSISPCGYAFLGEKNSFNFNGSTDLNDSDFKSKTEARVPVVLDWVIEQDTNCAQAEVSDSYACRYANTYCIDVPISSGGYRCSCKQGYEGNPYLTPGCKDIDECADPNKNDCAKTCINMPGNYKCSCPPGYYGDGRKNNMGCIADQVPRVRSQFPLIKLLIDEELKKATNNYASDTILGQGGYGIVFKECEVPLLVYEFVSNGTLFEHVHNINGGASWLSLENRLRIAAESSGALAYLHSATSIPVIHRDVKLANILLDDNRVAKISDFGASRLVPLDQTQVTTLVQGTLGYLDPEYFHTGQLTDKSDVYSFGVVLAELLTGRKPICMERSPEDRNIATYFITSVNENRLFQILEPRLVKEGTLEQLEIAGQLVKRCLSLNGRERPTMKEVTAEIESLRKYSKHPWANQQGIEEATSLIGRTEIQHSDLYEIQLNSYNDFGHGSRQYSSSSSTISLLHPSNSRR